MVEAKDVRGDLLARIAAKRASVQAHLRRHRPKSRRLTTATIVLTSLAAVFTAGPGVGGVGFTTAADALVPGQNSPVWQVLCLAAALVSVAAAIVSGLSKSQESTAKLNTAAAVDCELEGLAFLLEFGQLPVEDAVKLYRQYIAKIDFIEDDVTPVATGSASGAGESEPEPAPVVAGSASAAGEPTPTPRRERARQPVPADRRAPSADLPPVPPARRRASLRQTVFRQTPQKDETRRRLPPPPR